MNNKVIETPEILNGRKMVHHYVIDISLENQKALEIPQIIAQQQEEPKVSTDIEVKYRLVNPDQNLYEIIVSLKLLLKSQDDPFFIMSIDYAGLFKIQVESEEELKYKMLVDCPHDIFPYIRALVTLNTANTGFAPINIPHIDFANMYQQQQNQQPQQS